MTKTNPLKLGIIGHPIGHSVSPLMHKKALDELELEGSYRAFDTPEDELFDRIKYFKRAGYRGFNITVPLKVKTAFLLDDFGDCADLAGAVNTVVINEEQKLIGYNTDIYGFKRAISKKTQQELKGQKAVILGNGGAARAAAIGLIELGVDEIVFCARNEIKSIDLRRFFLDRFKNVKISTLNLSSDLMDNLDFREVAIVVNATPVGMQGVAENELPIPEKVISTLKQGSVLYDLVYKPKRTRFLKLARKYKLRTITGEKMLIYQGVKAFELWTNKKAPVKLMRQIVLKSI